MKTQKFKEYAMDENHPQYSIAISRKQNLYQRRHDLRSEFGRDYTRIIFSQAYRRLKHKTQVFFAVEDDHVCTRSEHVNLVESVSHTIASELGLNTELTKAIAVGHDLGHAPFGHGGEMILTTIAKEHHLDKFWHEKNSLHFVDDIELLEDNNHYQHNLNLTYALRDGIISHCGEMNQKFIQKRDEVIDLNDYQYAGQYNPWTYEGCVVKMSDKIAYLARDIEDALRLHVLKQEKVDELKELLNTMGDYQFHAINNGAIVNYFIHDVIENSDVNKGIGLSEEAFEKMKVIMKFNYENIYLIKRVQIHEKYVSLILHSLFDFLYAYGASDDILSTLEKDKDQYPKLIHHYITWLEKYAIFENHERKKEYTNKVVYDFICDSQALEKSIIDYLAGMSDAFIIQVFNELISF
ncbi:deoxyguanosinetriphosphate triphosphohydrolase family protein [Candidatus Stoquefichus massiliensis]|uniref:deoxyguanosinetriphosphate triphosphohydrolase family protein n=1 Tax=Candidatus Stoquefichus massiliensis TaxID=1470350 RepID=UPI0004805497|nr:HD domain-containing protein [Candidatus Stoquefichus massiliensis]